MPSWTELINEFQALPIPQRGPWFANQLNSSLADVSRLRGDSNVVFYGSGFLQKPQAPAQTLQINHEDLNAFMSVLFGMRWDRPLTLILHTPGGVTNATESIVAYLRSKFTEIEIVVPTYAMSAGTMVALAGERIIMGRQSQLGPIDAQMPHGQRYISARAVVDQFAEARAQILNNSAEAHLWAPVLATIGPSLLQEARNALDYGEEMVARWLATYMFRSQAKRAATGAGKRAAKHFNDAGRHKSHGRRIDRDEARSVGIQVVDLESDQDLQDAVLTAYHAMTILFEQTVMVKAVWSNTQRQWLKQWLPPGVPSPPGP
jgi:hypothetical protein